MSEHHRKFAVLITSYRRMEMLIRQIQSFGNQTYDDFHIFVAVKGVPEYYVETFMRPQFTKLFERGILTLRYFPNKNLTSNIVDCIRDLDISDYDVFCKVDDDDFYSGEYLELVNEYLNESGNTGGSFYRQDELDVIRMSDPVGYYEKWIFPWGMGSTICFSKNVMNALLKVNNNLMQYKVPKKDFERNYQWFGAAEDSMITHMASHMDGEKFGNISDFIGKDRAPFVCKVHRGKNSTVENTGDYLSNSRFKEDVSQEYSENINHHEHTVCVRFKNDEIKIRIVYNGEWWDYSDSNIHGNVIKFNNDFYYCTNGDYEEHFVKNEEGLFIQI